MSPRTRRRLPLVLATCFSAALLLSSVASSGLGEPYELDAADRARGFAVDVLGARALALDGLAAPPAVPAELAHGPLPVAAVALGFRLFGLHVWAGRLPMAVGGLAAVVALAFLLARLVDRRAAAYGAAALATMPLFFVEARTMLGDAVAMAASSIAFAGLGVAVFDRRRGPDLRVRLLALGLGALGLAAGALSRGALLGVAVPALGVGLAWLLLGRRRDVVAGVVGAGALLGGGVAAATAVRAGLGSAPHVMFDEVAHRLGHGLFPWSGLLPFAFLALLAPPARRGVFASRREEAARVLVLAGSVTALAAHAVAAPAVPFTAPAILAAALALAARDLDRIRRAGHGAGLRDATVARAAGLAAALLTLLLARDLVDVPDRALASILPLRAGSPLVAGGAWVRAAAVVFAGVLALAAFDRARRVAGGWASWGAPYLAWPEALRRGWDGRLATGLVVVEAMLVSLAASLLFRPAKAAPLGAVPRLLALHAFWAVPLATLAAVWIPLAARDALQAVRRYARLPRGGAVVVAGAAAGALLAWGHYPELLGRLSPREALSRYTALHAPGEPLGALGVSARAAMLEVGVAVRPLADAPAASSFLLTGAATPRRWLALRRDDLPALNALVRAREHRNAAVLAGGEGGVVLVASARLPGEPAGEGSLDDLVLPAAPPLAHPVDAALGDALVALGWDLWDGAGAAPTSALVPLEAHRLRFYYRVTGHLDDAFCSFVHIDGEGRRFNADHREFRRYPLRYWQAGDVLVDEFEVTLGGNFTPGDYALRYGFDRLPCDGHGRLPVKSGPARQRRPHRRRSHPCPLTRSRAAPSPRSPPPPDPRSRSPSWRPIAPPAGACTSPWPACSSPPSACWRWWAPSTPATTCQRGPSPRSRGRSSRWRRRSRSSPRPSAWPRRGSSGGCRPPRWCRGASSSSSRPSIASAPRWAGPSASARGAASGSSRRRRCSTCRWLGSTSLIDPWESHYGEVAREMIARDDWHLPLVGAGALVLVQARARPLAGGDLHAPRRRPRRRRRDARAGGRRDAAAGVGAAAARLPLRAGGPLLPLQGRRAHLRGAGGPPRGAGARRPCRSSSSWRGRPPRTCRWSDRWPRRWACSCSAARRTQRARRRRSPCASAGASSPWARSHLVLAGAVLARPPADPLPRLAQPHAPRRPRPRARRPRGHVLVGLGRQLRGRPRQRPVRAPRRPSTRTSRRRCRR